MAQVRIPRRTVVLVAALGVVVIAALVRRGVTSSGGGASRGGAALQAPGPQADPATVNAWVESQTREFVELEKREEEFLAGPWKLAEEAARHEEVLSEYWNGLNQLERDLKTVPVLQFDGITLPPLGERQSLGNGVIGWRAGSAYGSHPVPKASLNASSYSGFVEQVRAWGNEGWRIEGLSIRQVRFVVGLPPKSGVEVRLRLERKQPESRADVEATLAVEWKVALRPNAVPIAEKIEVESLRILRRDGPVPWELVETVEVAPRAGSEFVDPMVVADLDRDGRSELWMVGASQQLIPGDGGGLRKLGPVVGGTVLAAALVDLEGDGGNDLLVGSNDGLWKVELDGAGQSLGVSTLLWRAEGKWKHPQVLTVGDVDGDGDLDVLVAQYKLPYQGGQFPTPYFDANDGFPFSYLRNDGGGRWVDATAGSGLEGKRHRRVYSASWVDVNGDRALDLVLASDFAGIDVFLGDGAGHWREATLGLGETRHGFGMAHAVWDFDGDVRPDVLMMGMDSPVASTLESMGLERPGWERHAGKRAAMIYGNRVFRGVEAGLEAVVGGNAAGLARGGWAWGVAALDWDNDGREDFYVGNGHETLPRVNDYERQFWFHDVYVGRSTNNPVTDLYFRSASGRRRRDQSSYGGWQNNVLFQASASANASASGGAGWVDVGWVTGVGVSEDCRNVVSEDFDGDGRMDLAVSTFELWPKRRQRVFVFRNRLETANGWVGYRFFGGRATAEGIGSHVRVETTAGVRRRWMITGDGYRSQNCGAIHFGLGQAEVRRAVWVKRDGTEVELPKERGRWHSVR